MKVSEQHTLWGEAFGTFCWVWIFHRARLDGPVVLGWRHPWEHAPDPFNPHGHGDHADAGAGLALEDSWDSFTAKAMIQKEVDDDDEEEDEDDDE